METHWKLDEFTQEGPSTEEKPIVNRRAKKRYKPSKEAKAAQMRRYRAKHRYTHRLYMRRYMAQRRATQALQSPSSKE